MKIVFWLLLLLNIALPLWQWRAPEPVIVPDLHLPSILLDHELRSAQRGTSIEAVFQRQVADVEQGIVESLFSARAESSQNVETLLRASAQPVIQQPPPATRQSQVVPVTEQVASQPATKCYQVGPFSDQPSLMAWLKTQGLQADSTSVRDVDLPVDYQVLYPAATTPEQQNYNKQMLKDKGIVDLWTIPLGENKGALSLGVYTDLQRANQFRKQLFDKGIYAEIKQRVKTTQQYSAKLMLDDARRSRFSAHGTYRINACR